MLCRTNYPGFKNPMTVIIVEMNKQISKIGGKDMTEDTRIILDRLDTMDATMGKLGAGVETMKSDVKSVKSKVEVLGSKMETVESKIETLEFKIKNLESDMNEVKDITTEIRKVDTLCSAV